MFIIYLIQYNELGEARIYAESKDSSATGIARFRLAPYKMRLYKTLADASGELLLLKTFQPQLKKVKLFVADTHNSTNISDWEPVIPMEVTAWNPATKNA